MTMLFRSKSCGVSSAGKLIPISSPPTSSLYLSPEEDEQEDEDEEEEEEEDDVCFASNRVRTPFLGTEGQIPNSNSNRQQQNQILDIFLAALRKSLVMTCSVETDDVSSMDIGWPTDVKHVSHVTFDRFNGFLGLPVELEPEVPHKVPSASASVFGVSAKSMQCSYDERGNSVPTILLMMQKRLYMEGGLKAEGIFRINPENSQEQSVRHQLNKGEVPRGVDVHCLAGLIKAWFRELPTGILDSLNPEQVMHCNTEDECTHLVKSLPSTEAALLDWAINLMADVVRHEHLNKMNPRNIAMVFAPNMTQMADPLTALLHAVQVMNLLKTLIVVTHREREELIGNKSRSLRTYIEDDSGGRSPILHRSELTDDRGRLIDFTPSKNLINDYNGVRESEGILDKLKFKKGVRKLCKHPVFQLSKSHNCK
ncbi:rho GTPase-activating protein 3-like [Impatiens glandulifera]|uniref:rho GTPase-activating protein 3-like n=1 Tax=Impatiens glandulifera TaxID=253017 RepID=UPI001FB07168|nr:rho GTPase-activating protein 3-like [Impatiens glandulifera]XP_047338332.1 rho GTPase-activating protein 3-like [Impatiens glandulifera]